MWDWVGGKCPIKAITNAVNQHYWQDARIANAQSDEDLLNAKHEMKKGFIPIHFRYSKVKDLTQMFLTITWARRFADYKRAWLILMDKPRIEKLLNENKVQLIFAGKFHPDDTMGKEMFNKILKRILQHENVVVLPGYELALSARLKKALISG